MPKLSQLSDEFLENKYKEFNSFIGLANYLEVSNKALRQRFIRHNIPFIKRKFNLNEKIFEQESPEAFYMAGFIAADGWIYNNIDKNKRQHNQVGISLKEDDKTHLENIQKLISSNHNLYKRVIKNSKRNVKYKDSVSYTLLISSKKIVEDLKKFGISERKSLTYTIPEWVRNHELIRFFLLGYFDGDGSLSIDKVKKGRITPQARFHLRGTVNFLTDFNLILYKYCDLPTKNKKISIDSNIGSLQYTGNNNINKIMSFLYDGTPIYLNRKYNKYLEVKNIIDKDF